MDSTELIGELKRCDTSRLPEGVIARRRRAIVGTPGDVRRELDTLAAEYEADEVMVVTITYDHAARRRSYELLAGASR